jgi:hypothetical protein
MLAILPAWSQDDLQALLDKEVAQDQTIYTTATFKSTRLQNGHTIERISRGELDLRIHHRFGQLASGFDELFGLDESSSLISLEYGVTDWMMLGIGRATIDKAWNGFAKFSILRQSLGKIEMPISVSYLVQASYNTIQKSDADPYNQALNRTFYTHQLLIARKWTPSLSLQTMPTIVHRNLVDEPNQNDLFSLGFGGRYKFTKWVAINGEYYYTFNKDVQAGYKYKDSYSIGVDIDTGGHIFQLLISSSPYLLEHQFLSRSNGTITDGSVCIGFNIMRTFSLFDK